MQHLNLRGRPGGTKSGSKESLQIKDQQSALAEVWSPIQVTIQSPRVAPYRGGPNVSIRGFEKGPRGELLFWSVSSRFMTA